MVRRGTRVGLVAALALLLLPVLPAQAQTPLPGLDIRPSAPDGPVGTLSWPLRPVLVDTLSPPPTAAPAATTPAAAPPACVPLPGGSCLGVAADGDAGPEDNRYGGLLNGVSGQGPSPGDQVLAGLAVPSWRCCAYWLDRTDPTTREVAGNPAWRIARRLGVPREYLADLVWLAEAHAGNDPAQPLVPPWIDAATGAVHTDPEDPGIDWRLWRDRAWRGLQRITAVDEDPCTAADRIDLSNEWDAKFGNLPLKTPPAPMPTPAPAGLFGRAGFEAAEELSDRCPGIRIVGLSEAVYREADLADFLARVDAANPQRRRDGKAPIEIDAISWHELQGPWLLADHVAAARKLLDRFNDLGTGRPGIEINEYGRGLQQLLPPGSTAAEPGEAVAYLAGLRAAGVDEAAHACWDQKAAYGMDACNLGVDGLFDPRLRRLPLLGVQQLVAEAALGGWRRLPAVVGSGVTTPAPAPAPAPAPTPTPTPTPTPATAPAAGATDPVAGLSVLAWREPRSDVVRILAGRDSAPAAPAPGVTVPAPGVVPLRVQGLAPGPDGLIRLRSWAIRRRTAPGTTPGVASDRLAPLQDGAVAAAPQIAPGDAVLIELSPR